MNLVLIETTGNQSYIFATNKLRENVGASELTHRVGTRFTLEAVGRLTGQSLYDEDSENLRRNLLDERRNPRFEDGGRVEVIVATSGKALLLVRDAEDGKRIVSAVTERGLREAPGIHMHGVVVPFNAEQHSLHTAIKWAHEKHAESGGRLPSPEARFQRLPVVAECATSGLPAAVYDRQSPEPRKERSAVSRAKATLDYEGRSAAEDGLDRMRRVAKRADSDLRLARMADLERLEELDWLGVIHADGNGLGRVFLHFDQHVPDQGARPRVYIDTLRRFSLALDYCTEEAFRYALGRMQPRWVARQERRPKKLDFLPVVPLVLGGDDLTLVCDGRLAVQFAIEFVEKFEALTRADNLAGFRDVIPVVMRRPDGKGQPVVTSCAGVAIVKPHFPFHAAYELAEALLSSAKKEHNRQTAVDFHILYDASGPDLQRIRESLTAPDGARLVARPYRVTGQSNEPRHVSALKRRLEALRSRDEDERRQLPNSMLHELRQALFQGRTVAEARLGLVRERYKNSGIDHLLEGGWLFWPENGGYVTGLIDAMDLVEFWHDDDAEGR
jgi:hypothetical protein